MPEPIENSNRFLLDVKNKHLWILRKIEAARVEKPSRMLRRCQIYNGCQLPRSSFNWTIEKMLETGVIRQVMGDKRKYYELSELGKYMLNEYLPMELVLPFYEATLRIKERTKEG